MTAGQCNGACDCGCCEGLAPETPQPIENPPGLPVVPYRVGTHARFRATMLAALSSARLPALRRLATREDDDFSIALADAWATVADVLTFYQERIANESYLRTATERVSLLHLARLIGYELRPGVAASAFLAYVLETAKEAPRQVAIPIRNPVQSVPEPDEQPQTFETVEAIVARPEWNALRPRLLQPQRLIRNLRDVTVAGLGLEIKPGDDVLVIARRDGTGRVLTTALEVVEDPEARTTRLMFVTARPEHPAFSAPTAAAGVPPTVPTELTAGVVRRLVRGRRWRSTDLVSVAEAQGWPLADLTAAVAEELARRPSSGDAGVYVFRTRAAIFGHNAPLWDSLPGVLRYGEKIKDAEGDVQTVEPAYPNSWERRTLAQEQGTLPREERKKPHLFLDAPYPKIVERSWVALVGPEDAKSYRVVENVETSRAGFTLSAKITRLRLEGKAVPREFREFTIRETSVRGESERLTLADVPIPNPVSGTRIMLDGFYLGLEPGRRAILTGEPVDLPGTVVNELLTPTDVLIEDGYTVLVLPDALRHDYVRTSVTINANVALATHGETKQEVLGSGDADRPHQRFRLKQPPLTHVTAPTASGAETTLRVYVNGVRWHEVPTLYGLGRNDRVYVTRLDAESGTTVQFGDGTTGARLPSGAENVEARYRKGIGLPGLVRAGQLTLPLARPPGVRSIVNPLPAEGAADAEREDEARANAPRTVLTLDRVVSLQDFEDFARGFAGVTKALATWIWDPAGPFVLLTVAGAAGTVLDPAGVLVTNLRGAIRRQGDADARFELRPHRPAAFGLTAAITIHPDHLPPRVLAAVERALLARFSFDARTFGQSVAQSEVVAVIQGVEGVVSVDVDELYRLPRPSTNRLSTRLWPDVPSAGETPLLGAELLTLDPRHLQLSERT